MDERPDQIEEHINRTRGDLDSNIHELENKVRSAFDWRTQFEERPMVMLGAAMAGGIIAAAIIPRGGRRRQRYTDYNSHAQEKENRSSEGWTGSRTSERERERGNRKDTHDVLEALKSAVLTGVAAKIGSMLGELVNHYKEQLMTGSRHRDSRYSEPETGARTYDRERTSRPH